MPMPRAVLATAVLATYLLARPIAKTKLAPLDRAAQSWVEQTLKKMTLDERIGQLLVTTLNASFTSVDSDAFAKLRHLVRDVKVGGIHVFGATEPMPALVLNPTYGAGGGAARKGDPYVAAALLNRLQSEAEVPLLTTADFEGGVGYMMNGATRLPRAMAIGATRDTELAYRAGKVSAEEGRALGVCVDFYPIVDVNNNARNPIINIRSFGEDVRLVSEMARAYIRGVQEGGMLATAKHFPGHGDTATDTHLGLAVIEHPRAQLDQVELPPFRCCIRRTTMPRPAASRRRSHRGRSPRRRSRGRSRACWKRRRGSGCICRRASTLERSTRSSARASTSRSPATCAPEPS